jgi:solute carrier family 25 (mitochondrial oxoglutarate transporter), member 11
MAAATNNSSALDAIKPFVFGGISGCTATSVIQPIDTVKVRIQIVSKNLAESLKAEGKGGKVNVSFMSVAKEILKNDGIKGFYKGLDSALMRQVFYGTTRLGLFKTLSDNIKNAK